MRVLSPVLTAPEAMKEDAPILLDDLRTTSFGEKTDKVSNVASHFQYKLGDLQKGLAEADVVVKREFNTATVHQGYIEPQNITVLWNEDDRILIWISTQGPFEIRRGTALAVGVPDSQVKVTPMEIGGGFGGKFPLYHEPIAVLLSKKSGQAVKIVMNRQEVFEGTGPTPGCYVKVKIGPRRRVKSPPAMHTWPSRRAHIPARRWRRALSACSPHTISPTPSLTAWT